MTELDRDFGEGIASVVEESAVNLLRFRGKCTV
jgi:hypothetical protein